MSRHLIGVAHNIAATFCSRNNDVAGYWCLGHLLRAAYSLGLADSWFDLGSDRSSPHYDSPILSNVPPRYRAVASRLAGSASQESPCPIAGTLVVSFRLADPKPNAWPENWTGYTCSVELKAPDGRAYVRELHGRCYPFSGAFESRSARATASEKASQTVGLIRRILRRDVPFDYGLFLLGRSAYYDSQPELLKVVKLHHKWQIAQIKPNWHANQPALTREIEQWMKDYVRER